MKTTISVDELTDLIQHGRDFVVIDVRSDRDAAVHGDYNSAHIPLAIYCDPSVDLAGVPDREAGRNPMPELARVEEAVRRWGISEDHLVVVYDIGDGFFSARAWWVLNWAGLKNVRVLEGGMQAWIDKGYQLAYGPGNRPQPGKFQATAGNMAVIDIPEVKTWTEHGVLIDVREADRFEGTKERKDLAAGHIPGAVNLPAQSLRNEDGSFLPGDVIRERLAGIGVTDGAQVAIYSGSGLNSSMFMQAMYEADMPGAAMFVGGWSKWAGDPTLPIAHA